MREKDTPVHAKFIFEIGGGGGTLNRFFSEFSKKMRLGENGESEGKLMGLKGEVRSHKEKRKI